MIKETTGAFDGTRTHDLHITRIRRATHCATPPLMSSAMVFGLEGVHLLACWFSSILLNRGLLVDKDARIMFQDINLIICYLVISSIVWLRNLHHFPPILSHFEGNFTVAISDVVGSRLSHFVGKSTVAISNVVSSWLGHFEGKFTVAIRFGNLLSVWRSIHFELWS